jgi:hypothetical protein
MIILECVFEPLRNVLLLFLHRLLVFILPFFSSVHHLQQLFIVLVDLLHVGLPTATQNV